MQRSLFWKTFWREPNMERHHNLERNHDQNVFAGSPRHASARSDQAAITPPS